MPAPRQPDPALAGAPLTLRLDHVPEPAAVTSLAAQARHCWGATPDAKLDLGRACNRLGVEVREVALEVPAGGAQGFLIPRPGGFLIEVDPEPHGSWESVPRALRAQLRRHRKRFLIAHELTHTFFYGDGPTGPRRVVFDSPQQEIFCDEMARALLVPAAVAAALPFEPESAVEIQRRFDVSMEVALRALAAAHGDHAVAWLLLRTREETLIQWTSANGRLTKRAMKELRTLATGAAKTGRSESVLLSSGSCAFARHLPKRNQVIVTWAGLASR